MTAADIARNLHGRKSGAGWVARCPSHDDNNPSLSLIDRDGKVLVYCHAGCVQDAVIAALKIRCLWPERNEEYPLRSVVATYDYTDEKGNLLYQIVRYEPKDFKQRQPDGLGDWDWTKCNRQVLYRLPEVLEAPIVFVVEGERDAETLRAHGFVATTNAGGSKARWLPEYTAALQGREVILIPDNDAPGLERVLTICRELLNHAARIRVLELTDGKDVTEWFERGHGELELIAAIEGNVRRE